MSRSASSSPNPRRSQNSLLDDDCICCPYGSPLVITGALGFFAFVFTTSAGASCDFMRTELSPLLLNQTRLALNDTAEGSLGIGLSFLDVQHLFPDKPFLDECVPYDRNFVPDAPQNFGRFVADLAFFIGFTLFVMILLASCRDFSKTQYMLIISVGCVTVAFSTLFMLTFLASKLCEGSGCHLGGGGIDVFIGCILWLLCAFSTVNLRSQNSDETDNNDDDGMTVATNLSEELEPATDGQEPVVPTAPFA